VRFELRRPPEWGADPVPAEKRVLRGFDIGVLWFSLGVGLLVLATGALLVGLVGLTLIEAVLVTAVGSVIGSLMLAGAGLIGSRYGVPSMVSLRPVLGRRGSYVPTALNVLQLIGWTAFEVMIIAEAATYVLGQPQGSAANYGFVVGFGLFCGFLAYGGPLVVIRQWLEKFGVWLVIALTVLLTVVLFSNPAAPGAWGGFSSPPTSLSLGLDLVIVMPISWWPLVADFNRFARRPREAAASTATGYAAANIWFYILGAGAVAILGLSNPIAAVGALALFGLPLLVLLVDETDNAFANIYSSGVSTQNLLPRMRQPRLVALFTALGIGLGAALTFAGGFSMALVTYEPFLLFIGGFFVPLLGVLAADWFVVRRGIYSPEEFRSAGPRWRLVPLAAWGVGVIVYFALSGIWLLRVDAVLAVGGSLPSFGVAFVLYAALSRLIPADRPAGQRAPGA